MLELTELCCICHRRKAVIPHHLRYMPPMVIDICRQCNGSMHGGTEMAEVEFSCPNDCWNGVVKLLRERPGDVIVSVFQRVDGKRNRHKFNIIGEHRYHMNKAAGAVWLGNTKKERPAWVPDRKFGKIKKRIMDRQHKQARSEEKVIALRLEPKHQDKKT